ncbi:hypothetical protein JG687_00007459 [Phytophthora cactorum]|uniref:Uncharacterized protein n=1 Tax=Phytophthora cactorum TaxID=29920 RepID=A0A329RXX8_9STRA|nr:hypothetical protein JG687_00007459 [Phytophthora cactorum]RAW29335.1 hypothetical protein PC110_g14302 [Phytophthora cactorum]
MPTRNSRERVTGTDQNSASFWDRVHGAYRQLAGASATAWNAGARQSRWAVLIDVVLYASSLSSAKAGLHSGWTDYDYVAKANNRFTAKREQLNANAR